MRHRGPRQGEGGTAVRRGIQASSCRNVTRNRGPLYKRGPVAESYPATGLPELSAGVVLKAGELGLHTCEKPFQGRSV
jgi:hypothetical protein